jgi:uncharacterized protein (DUF2267 family)
MMTLARFRTLTAEVPPPVLRQALAQALSKEAPHSPESYERFYSRVVQELGVEARTECSSARSAVAAQPLRLGTWMTAG